MAAEQITDESLAFLYRAAASRGPGKRPVRVVSREKLLANFESLGAASDDDDEDFKPNDVSASEDEEASSDEDDVSNVDADETETGRKSLSESNSGKFDSDEARVRSDTATNNILPRDEKASSNAICCLCLNLRFADQEVVQCDLCGVGVHEGCYGIAEEDWTAAENGSDSESTTEPWFCEPCLAGLNPRPDGDVYCELCPVKGGAYKRTDAGRWVHLTCAFYTPKVTFGDVFHLSHVSLSDVVASPTTSSRRRQRDGGVAKPCAFCADRLAARTGVPIKCDAGLCKQYAHIMCAQRRGLLVDSSASNYNDFLANGGASGSTHKAAMGSGLDPSTVADPYYWCCPVHSDRAAVQLKKRLQARVDASEAAFKPRRLTERERDKLAFRRAQFRSVWAQRQRSHPQNAVAPSVVVAKASADGDADNDGDERPPRLLSSSFEFMDKMRLKTVAATGDADDIDAHGNISVAAQRRWLDDFRVGFRASLVSKWSVPPAFAADFVAYYEARERRLMPSLRADVQRLGDQTTRLTAEQDALLNDGELKEAQREFDTLLTYNKTHYAKLVRWCDLLNALHCKNVKSPVEFKAGPTTAKKKLNLNVKKSTDRQLSDEKSINSPQSSPSHATASIGQSKSPLAVRIYECVTCGLSTDQHKLAFCDTCQKRYHLACLDPPLTKMPRKGAKFGWECSNCFKRNSDSESATSDKELPNHIQNGPSPEMSAAKFGKLASVTGPRRLRASHKPVNRLISEKAVEVRRSPGKRQNIGPGRPRKSQPAPVDQKRIKVEPASDGSEPPTDQRRPPPSAETRRPRAPRFRNPRPENRNGRNIDVEDLLNKYRQKTVLHKSRMAAAALAAQRVRRRPGRPPTARHLLNSLRNAAAASAASAAAEKAAKVSGGDDVTRNYVMKPESGSPGRSAVKPASNAFRKTDINAATGRNHLPALQPAARRTRKASAGSTKSSSGGASVGAISNATSSATAPKLKPFDGASTNGEDLSDDAGSVAAVADGNVDAAAKPKRRKPRMTPGSRIRSNYTLDDMQEAIRLVNSKAMGPTKACAQFDIPRSSLVRHLSRIRRAAAAARIAANDAQRQQRGHDDPADPATPTNGPLIDRDSSSMGLGKSPTEVARGDQGPSVKDSMHTYSSPTRLHLLPFLVTGAESPLAKKSPVKNKQDDLAEMDVIRVEDL